MTDKRRSVVVREVADPASEFRQLVAGATRAITELDPVRASWLGLRGRHDHMLADCSPEGTARARVVLSELLASFAAIPTAGLDEASRIDCDLVQGTVSALVNVTAQRPRWRTMPQAAMAEVLSGISVHLVRGCGTLEERGSALLGRLRGVPAFLEQSRRSLEAPPPVFTEVAILAAENTRLSLPRALSDFIATVDGTALARSLERAGNQAVEALATYDEFLRSDLMPRSSGDFRLGADLFNNVLREEHRMPMDGDELVVLGERIYHGTLREIRSLAGQISPGSNWSRLLLELKAESPAPPDLERAYREAVQTARDFLVGHRLATIPDREELIFLPTPAFASRRFSHAGYLPCGASDQAVRGIFLVTSPDPDAPPLRQRAMMRGHSYHAIRVRALRETYPGRHLQFIRAAHSGRPLRQLFPSALFTQGWSLYCEEMMEREGFLEEDRVRFLQLRERLTCACRILVDVGLHTGRMSATEAVAFLVRKAKLERADAVKEVQRCCEEPTVMMSSLVGKLLLEEILEDERERRGGDFSLGAFHDAVLDQGALPPDLLRQALGLPRRRTDREMFDSLTRAPRRARRTPAPRPSRS
jgi:uncharacterized protein (DUF885 family)